ncbi:hypothetical protein HYI36_18535 [Bacillus sp. Gen3]|nr:hypothetical protein [Bacillus sp. Gen3]
MLEDVKKRLVTFGYTALPEDEWILGFTIEKVENLIKNDCNVLTVPDGLRQIAVDMVCGEFLFGKKSLGALSSVDLEAVVKTIKEGDTQVTFAIGEGSQTPEQRFDSLVNYLINYGKPSFASYRCIKW